MPLLDAVLQGLLFGGLYALYARGMALLLEIFTADARSLPGDGLESASVALGPLNLGVLPLHIFGAALFLTVAVHLLLAYTAFGRALRASAADSEAAAITGVNPRHVYA